MARIKGRVSPARDFTPAEIARFQTYLTETLIPDLKESGREFTAQDFETAVRIIDQLSQE